MSHDYWCFQSVSRKFQEDVQGVSNKFSKVLENSRVNQAEVFRGGYKDIKQFEVCQQISIVF